MTHNSANGKNQYATLMHYDNMSEHILDNCVQVEYSEIYIK